MEMISDKHEKFARACVELCNYASAYKLIFAETCAGAQPATVRTRASLLAHTPRVAARIRELRDEAAAKALIPSLAARMQELRLIEEADPNELISLLQLSCRHCRGTGYGYQWIDDAEYAYAADKAVAANQPLPSLDGGFGFNPTLEPIPECPRCYGEGVREVKAWDTTRLSASARLLYKGARLKANGDIEILMHDQMHARDMLNRITGAYKDSFAAFPAAAETAAGKTALEAVKTPEERQRTYLRLVSG